MRNPLLMLQGDFFGKSEKMGDSRNHAPQHQMDSGTPTDSCCRRMFGCLNIPKQSDAQSAASLTYASDLPCLSNNEGKAQIVVFVFALNGGVRRGLEK